MIRFIIHYGPVLIIFLTVLLTTVITTVAVPRLMIPILVVVGIAVLARYLFGPLR